MMPYIGFVAFLLIGVYAFSVGESAIGVLMLALAGVSCVSMHEYGRYVVGALAVLYAVATLGG